MIAVASMNMDPIAAQAAEVFLAGKTITKQEVSRYVRTGILYIIKWRQIVPPSSFCAALILIHRYPVPTNMMTINSGEGLLLAKNHSKAIKGLVFVTS